MNASMIDGHTDDGYYDSITIDGVNIGCREEAINNHVCENCLHLHHTNNGICICDKTCYDAAVVVRGVPTSQYFWCKGNLREERAEQTGGRYMKKEIVCIKFKEETRDDQAAEFYKSVYDKLKDEYHVIGVFERYADVGVLTDGAKILYVDGNQYSAKDVIDAVTKIKKNGTND